MLTLAADDAAPRSVPRTAAPAKAQIKKDAKPPLRRPEFQAKATAATASPPFPTGLRNPFVDPAGASATKPTTKAATLSGELKNPFPTSGQAKANNGAPPQRAPTQLVTAGNDLQNPFPSQTPRPTGQQAPLPTGLKNPFVDPAAASESAGSSSAPKTPSSTATKQPSATATRCAAVPNNAVDAHAPVPCPPSPATSSKRPTKDG